MRPSDVEAGRPGFAVQMLATLATPRRADHQGDCSLASRRAVPSLHHAITRTLLQRLRGRGDCVPSNPRAHCAKTLAAQCCSSAQGARAQLRQAESSRCGSCSQGGGERSKQVTGQLNGASGPRHALQAEADNADRRERERIEARARNPRSGGSDCMETGERSEKRHDAGARGLGKTQPVRRRRRGRNRGRRLNPGPQERARMDIMPEAVITVGASRDTRAVNSRKVETRNSGPCVTATIA